MAYIFFRSISAPPPHSALNNRTRIGGEFELVKIFRRRKRVKPSTTSSFVALSAHSNPKIIRSNRKSRYGELLSLYDSDSDDDFQDFENLEDDELFFSSDDDEFSEDEDFGGDSKNSSSKKKTSRNQGHRQTTKGGIGKLSRNEERGGMDNVSKGKLKASSVISDQLQLETRTTTKSRFHQLSEELELDEKWFPLLDYLSTFGLKESHFKQIYERHMASLQINVASAQERLEFLLSVGVKHRDIKRILLRQPQILGYTVENNLKSHVAFLVDMGIPHSRIGQIICAAPSLFSYSVEQSLKPTVRYLVEEVGIKTSDVSKVVQLSPQILVQRLDNSWSTRFGFLSKELGAPKDSIVKMVRKHPQLLHYSIEDGILPRINFLRSIGMCDSDVLKVLTGLTQVLSLSLEDNLKPKYLYLVNELKNEVQSLTKYPTYLSLSLDQRIRPRHRFLVSLKKAPKGPFPLSSFVPTDESFCHQWAKTSLDKYLAFRQNLLLNDLAKKYKRRG